MGIDREQQTLTSQDGTRLNAVVWAPERHLERTLIITHGLAEHMGRYGHVAEAFVEAGWRVIGLELRGHGDSDGKRGHVDAWSQYVEDLQAAITFADGPVWVLGHSMGGLIVLDALCAGEQPKIKGVVLTNPLVGALVEAPAWKLALAGVLSVILPGISLDNELDPTLISRDEAVVKAYVADEKVFSTITPRWYTQMRETMARVSAGAASCTTPLLMVTSDQDKICSAQASRELMEQYGENGEEKRYEGLYHEVLNEPEKDQVLEDIIAWLS